MQHINSTNCFQKGYIMSEKPLVGLSIGGWQNQFGDEEALKMAKAAGADAVDFDLLNYDETLYNKSEDEIFSNVEKVAKTAASLDLIGRNFRGRYVDMISPGTLTLIIPVFYSEERQKTFICTKK